MPNAVGGMDARESIPTAVSSSGPAGPVGLPSIHGPGTTDQELPQLAPPAGTCPVTKMPGFAGEPSPPTAPLCWFARAVAGARNPAAVWGSAPAGGSGMLRSCVVTVRLVTPAASVSYIGELGLVEPPNPSACPSSWSIVVSKSYCPAPIWVGADPAYQFQPWIMVISLLAALKQPSTPLETPPQAPVVPISITILAR